MEDVQQVTYTVEHKMLQALRRAIEDVFAIEGYALLHQGDRPLVEFTGRLLGDSEWAFAVIEERFRALGYTPLLTEEQGEHKLRTLPAVFDQKPGAPWLNAVLFVLTLLSVMYIGAANATGPGEPFNLWRGWPAAATLMGILTAHELSHYFVARRYGSPVSLPYFVPMPFNILGTMGAVIVQGPV